jgi:hypothetical protein
LISLAREINDFAISFLFKLSARISLRETNVDLNVRWRIGVSAAQVLEMAGASALGRHPLGVDFRRPAAGWRFSHGLALPCGRRPQRPASCSCFVHYLVKQNAVSRFCFFELRFFGKEVNPVSWQAFTGRDVSGKRERPKPSKAIKPSNGATKAWSFSLDRRLDPRRPQEDRQNP